MLTLIIIIRSPVRQLYGTILTSPQSQTILVTIMLVVYCYGHDLIAQQEITYKLQQITYVAHVDVHDDVCVDVYIM